MYYMYFYFCMCTLTLTVLTKVSCSFDVFMGNEFCEKGWLRSKLFSEILSIYRLKMY